MKLWRWCLLIFVVAICSCAIPNPLRSATSRYRFEIKDQPDRKQFLVILRSLDHRMLCIYESRWPSGGRLCFGKTWTRVESLEGTFRGGELNCGYSIDQNGMAPRIRIPPYTELRGIISYEEFGKPNDIAKLTGRRLIFPVRPEVCE